MTTDRRRDGHTIIAISLFIVQYKKNIYSFKGAFETLTITTIRILNCHLGVQLLQEGP